MRTKHYHGGRSPSGGGAAAYFKAAALVLLALGLRYLMDPIWKDHLPFGFFFLAVLATCQFADVGPCLFAGIAGFFLGDWFFVQPRHTFVSHDSVALLNSILYFPVCFYFGGLSFRLRRALRLEREAALIHGQMAAIVRSSDDAIIGMTLDGTITTWNAAAEKLYGYKESEALGHPADLLLKFQDGGLGKLLQRVANGEHIRHFEMMGLRKDGHFLEVSLTLSPILNPTGQIMGASTIGRDISERKRAERERECLVNELQSALREVKTLGGLLPICSQCKKIRDDKGYWSQLEQYLHEHSNAEFTHGICPDCAGRLYQDIVRARFE